jgi:hypothetical protein
MRRPPRKWCAVDMPRGYRLPGVELQAEHEIPEAASKDEGWNLSDKRNVGLLLGKMLGLRRILFKDDDLKIDIEALQPGLKLLRGREIVGFGCGGFPDKSVLMHVAGAVNTFHYPKRHRPRSHDLRAGQLSANSMLLDPLEVRQHFPRRSYNEDWIFAHDIIARGKAGLAPHKYYQDAYDPFVAARAKQEEFGEVTIDGLYGELKRRNDGTENGSQMHEPAYWQSVIELRRRQYERLLVAVSASRNSAYWAFGQMDSRQWQGVTMPDDEQKQLRLPLQAGLAVNEVLDGRMLVRYIKVWQEDQRRWEARLERITEAESLPMALADLGLEQFATNIGTR